jgi:DNA polymerase-3 subunit alpha
MQLAQKLAGYSLGEADLMRRAMGKKKKEEMAAHEEKFINGAIERGIAKEKAATVFNLMAQFADYGFNRSHSFAYAYLAYQTAFLKAHYPTHFYAAVLSNEASNTEKLSRYITEMKSFGIQVLPPDVNTSHEGFTAVGNAVRFGLAAIKGIGSSAVQMIIQARVEGAFRSIFDFAERVDSRAANKRVFESLIKSGAFDCQTPNRAAMLAAVDRAIENGARAQKDKASGQTGLFTAFAEADNTEPVDPPLPDVKSWSRKELLGQEKDALGFYASGHPLEDYSEAIQSLTNTDAGNITERTDGEIIALGGMVVDLAIKTTKKGDRFALFRIEDQFGSVKIVCWPESFNKYKALLQADMVLLVRGKLELTDEGAATIFAQEIQQLENARAGVAKAFVVKLSEETIGEDMLTELGELLGARQGNTPVFFDLKTSEDLLVRVRANQFLRVQVTPKLIEDIGQICSKWEVVLE